MAGVPGLNASILRQPAVPRRRLLTASPVPLSTLAAEWYRTYSGKLPDLPRALEFYDRWLPGTMRRVGEHTRACIGQCSVSRRLPYDWTGR